MPVARCPHCASVLLEEEAQGSVCPACGRSLETPACTVTAASPEAETPPVQPAPRRAWGWMAVAACSSIFSLVLWVGRPETPAPLAGKETTTSRLPGEEEQAKLAGTAKELMRLREEMRAATEDREAQVAALEKKLTAVEAAASESRQVLEKQLATAVAGAELAGRRAAAAEKALEEERARRSPAFVGPGEVRLDDPAGEHVVDTLNEGDRLKLTGRIGVLRIRGVNDGELDASALQARSIVFEQPVNGRSAVKLSAPGGSVALAGINAEARVEVEAPGGTLRTPDINGDSRLSARAREVRFEGAVQGSSKVSLTLTANGFMRFGTIQGSATVTWKRERASDPNPNIQEGEVRGGGRFLRAE